MNFSIARRSAVALLLILAICDSGARTLRLFVVGNSFSNNATHYLPELAKSGGHELIMAKAEAGGCSFARHWAAVEASLVNPNSAEARIYGGGKSLAQHMGAGAWDVITIQQYSLHSSDVATYRPFAPNLHAHLKKLQPKAEIVMHQTWAYRADAKTFGLIGNGKNAANQREMWEYSRAAYWQMARELGTRVIPTGDAFWRVDSDPQWGFKADKKFNPKTAQAPALPVQKNSLHVGYRWKADKLNQDANHANVAGEYLGALVWYGFLFKESPEKLAFVPAGITPDFAAHLRRVAWATVQSVEAENKKVAAGKAMATR